MADSKKKQTKVYLIPESESRDSHTYHYMAVKTKKLVIENQKLTAGHAKILVGLDNASFVANKIIEKKLSVRQAENFVKIFKNRKKSSLSKDTNIIALELSISNKIGLNVDIKNNKRNKGRISFEYKDLDQLNKIIDIIKSNY